MLNDAKTMQAAHPGNGKATGQKQRNRKPQDPEFFEVNHMKIKQVSKSGYLNDKTSETN